MPVDLRTPDVSDLPGVLDALRSWQLDGLPVQLHPGDVGWQWRLGAEAVASTVRTWSRDGRVLSVGFGDESVHRLGIDPEAAEDTELADAMLRDLGAPERGVLPGEEGSVEVRFGPLLRARLADLGWTDDEPWTPLTLDLGSPVDDVGLRVEVVAGDLVSVRTAVQRAAFDSSRFTDDLWHTMATGPTYADARCLLAFDDAGSAVAATTVWSAGPGRRGLIEPLGVHRDHRGHGYGPAITRAAATALRELGSSSVAVCTPSANVGGVATYESAGMVRHPDVVDLRRPPVT